MSYRLSAKRDLSRESRRVLLDELRGTLQEVRGPDGNHNSEAIHEARKHLKKARALVRLVRSGVGDKFYERENAGMRRVAQHLAPIRDAHVREQTLRKLLDASPDGQTRTSLARVHRATSDELARLLVASNERDWNKPPIADLEQVLGRVRKSSLRSVDSRSVGCGVKRSYKKAREALKVARREHSDEKLHELRKRVKDVWYDLRLLGRGRHRAVKRLADRVGKLADRLGDHHDLAMLEAIPRESEAYTPRDWDALSQVVASKKSELKRDALHLATQVLREKPQAFSEWAVAHWQEA